MTPQQARSALDRMLRQAGRRATLTRYYGTQLSPVSVDLRVHIANYTQEELVKDSTLVAGARKAIISTTEINAAQWPGAVPDGQAEPGDPRIPRHGDKLTLASGEVLTVEHASDAPLLGEYDELVRINLVVV
jgi:hypothetical protein